MTQPQHPSKLEAFYEQDAWRDEVARAAFEKRISLLWKAIIGEIIILFLLVLGLTISQNLNLVGIGITGVVAGVLVSTLPAALIAYLIGLIPFQNKSFDYSDRRFFWFLLFLALIGAGAVVGCVIFMASVFAF